MSEYQYYEFQTVDRRLTEKEMQQLRAYSTRARITPSSFVNEYHFGDFKGDPDAWMERYFDGFLYFANWGTRELQLALPTKVLAPDTAHRYCCSEMASAREKSGKLILTFLLQEDGGGEWIEGEGILSSLLQIRTELAHGDHRVLYLGWLIGVQTGELDREELEPPVPPNLGHLSAVQESFADFFDLDPDLLAVAAKNSPRGAPESMDGNELSSWIGSLPTKEKDEMLVRLMAGEEMNVGMELQAQFHRRRSAGQATSAVSARTVGELLAGAETHREAREQEEKRKAAIAEEKRRREAAMAREKHLDSLKGRTEEIWSTVEGLVATRQPKSYDLVVQRLLDLRDVATRENRPSDFVERYESFRGNHSAKPSLLGRLARAGL
jgi:hypothetical protein